MIMERVLGQLELARKRNGELRDMIVSLIQAIRKASDENQYLKGVVDRAITSADIVGLFADEFQSMGVCNYVERRFSSTRGDFIVTVRSVTGKSPADIAREAMDSAKYWKDRYLSTQTDKSFTWTVRFTPDRKGPDWNIIATIWPGATVQRSEHAVHSFVYDGTQVQVQDVIEALHKAGFTVAYELLK